jgi:hypothetical protein
LLGANQTQFNPWELAAHAAKASRPAPIHGYAQYNASSSTSATMTGMDSESFNRDSKPAQMSNSEPSSKRKADDVDGAVKSEVAEAGIAIAGTGIKSKENGGTPSAALGDSPEETSGERSAKIRKVAEEE